MATLNTLRTRFGVVLSAIIAFALLAFIFSLKAEMGFMGGEVVVAEINGHDVTGSEYQQEYNSMQRLMGADMSNEQQSNMVYAQTWNALFSKFALQPGFAEMGIAVGEQERVAILRGEVSTQTMFSAFGNPQTGVYDTNAVNSFLLSSQGNPEAEAMWASINEQARNERLTTKYATLAAQGAYINALEVAQGVDAANKSFDGRVVSKRYSDIADSLVKVSASEIKEYYNSRKSQYKRLPTRTISYVNFRVEPSKDDLLKIEQEATATGEEFAAAADIRKFIRSNRNGSVASTYLTEGQLIPAEAEALVAGKMYGPANVDNSWKISRVVEKVTAPDTLSIRHIVLSYSDRPLADSLLTVLRKGGDFAQIASTYSQYAQSAQAGGEIGALPFSAFTDEFSQKLASAKVNDIIDVETEDMIQLVQVYKVGKRVPHYKVASISLAITPSEATRRTIHNSAGVFAVAAKGDVESFKAAAGESKTPSRTSDITSASRTIPAIAGSENIARWAHKAEMNDLSEIFKVDNGYVVAMLSGINESEYRALSEVEPSIKRELIKDKKYDMIVDELGTVTSLDDQADSWGSKAVDFSDISYSSTFLSGVGAEPRLFGAISVATKGAISDPVKGNAGVYLFEVNAVKESEEPQSAEAEKVRATAAAQAMLQQQLFQALEGMSEMKDMRGETL